MPLPLMPVYPPISKNKGYTYLRWMIYRNRSLYQQFQVNEIELRKGGAKVPWPAGATSVDYESNPGGEGPDKLISETNSKWLAWSTSGNEPKQAADASIIQINLGEQVEFDGYRYKTANDSSGRDPVSWTLLGSNDATNWGVIDSKISQSITTSRNTWTPVFSIPSANQSFSRIKYRYWRWWLAQPKGSDTQRVTELELRKRSGGSYTSVDWPAGASGSAASGSVHGSYPISNMLDGNTSTRMQVSSTVADIRIDGSSEIEADAFRFRVEDEDFCPSWFSFFGSNDNSSWNCLYAAWSAPVPGVDNTWSTDYVFGRTKQG